MGSIDKYSEIFECILKHVKPWQKYISSIDQVEIKKLNGVFTFYSQTYDDVAKTTGGEELQN